MTDGKLIVLIGEDIGAENLARLESRFPTVRFHMALDASEQRELAPDVDIVFTKSLSDEVLSVASQLRWVQAGTAGINRWLEDPRIGREVVLTNARGAHGVPMAELILSMMLAFATGLVDLIRAQAAPNPREVREGVRGSKFEVQGQTLCVLGLGDIGGTLAAKAAALGLHILGVRRSGAPHPHVDEVFRPQARAQAMARADHVALCLPLTAETAGIVGEEELRAMRPSAYIYNVGRGASIEPDALLRALGEGWIAGAGLDVTDPEPLPLGSPLWSMRNVILSQHTSGSSPYNARRITEIFADNLASYLSGRPLRNVVRRDVGY